MGYCKRELNKSLFESLEPVSHHGKRTLKATTKLSGHFKSLHCIIMVQLSELEIRVKKKAIQTLIFTSGRKWYQLKKVIV